MKLKDKVYTVRICEGQLDLITRFPEPSPIISSPFSSSKAGSIPKKGFVALPGFIGVNPDIGVIIIAPVSVCHQVSTIGQDDSPTTLKYHSHASGLIGSPTVPSILKDFLEEELTNSFPCAIKALKAVGAV